MRAKRGVVWLTSVAVCPRQRAGGCNPCCAGRTQRGAPALANHRAAPPQVSLAFQRCLAHWRGAQMSTQMATHAYSQAWTHTVCLDRLMTRRTASTCHATTQQPRRQAPRRVRGHGKAVIVNHVVGETTWKTHAVLGAGGWRVDLLFNAVAACGWASKQDYAQFERYGSTLNWSSSTGSWLSGPGTRHHWALARRTQRPGATRCHPATQTC